MDRCEWLTMNHWKLILEFPWITDCPLLPNLHLFFRKTLKRVESCSKSLIRKYEEDLQNFSLTSNDIDSREGRYEEKYPSLFENHPAVFTILLIYSWDLWQSLLCRKNSSHLKLTGIYEWPGYKFFVLSKRERYEGCIKISNLAN